MKIGADSYKTVVVLGAGASRAAKLYNTFTINRSPVGLPAMNFAPPISGQALPSIPSPLDKDFWECTTRLPEPLKSKVAGLLAGTARLTGTPWEYGMEELFTRLEIEATLARSISASNATELAKEIPNFKKALATTIAYATGFEAPGHHNHCVWHHLLALPLESLDTVISFNYDLLIDDTLHYRQAPHFHDASGLPSYGVKVSGASTVAPGAGDIQLLKLHGSLNWEKFSNGELVAQPDPVTLPKIIPPAWDKDLSRDPYKTIWKKAEQALQDCEAVCVIGYSAPRNDVLAAALLTHSSGRLKALLVTDPSEDSRKRVTSLLARRVGSSTSLGGFVSIQDLALQLGWCTKYFLQRVLS